MPKTAVQTQVCDICGADVREGSLFCYNCGGSLKQAEIESEPQPLPPVAVAAPSNGASKTTAADKRLQRRRRSIDRDPIEVVWEPREGFSVAYVVVGVVLLLIALLLFITAMWLK